MHSKRLPKGNSTIELKKAHKHIVTFESQKIKSFFNLY